MKKIISLISMLFVGYIALAQTIIIDDNYTKEGPVLRFNKTIYTDTVYLYDSSMGTDSICGRVACVCNIDKRGKVKKLDVLWFFQRYPSNVTFSRKGMDPHLYKTIVDDLGIQIRKNGVIICPSSVKIKGTRQSFSIPIVISRNRETTTMSTKKIKR